MISTPKIKICGITQLEPALFAQEYGAGAIGFVFYKKSKRYISPVRAMEICGKIKIKKVGVFVNETPDIINEISYMLNLDFVQLHGDESFDMTKLLSKPIIKRIDNFDDVKKYNNASYYLIDAKDKINWGGTGKLSDWNLAKQIKSNNKKIILSGGLNSKNIISAIESVQPDWVDISSGIEDAPGIKNLKLMKQFFEKIQNMEKTNV